MKQFKIRCSQIGQIMTNPRSKTEYYFAGAVITAQKYNKIIDGAIKTGDYDALSKLEARKVDIQEGELSETVKTYLQRHRIEEIYGRSEEITSKQMEKGIQMEAEAIELAARYFGWGMVFKNEKQYKNDYLTGTPDIVLADTVPDIKCPWSCFTFPLFDTEPDKNYWWQLQGYMALTGLDKAKLVYCLMDTPEDLLDTEVYYGVGRGLEEEKIRAYHTYSNLPDKLRIKSFDILRDQEAIDSIYKRVEECREYYLEMVQMLTLTTTS
jgi:hypothetical protein